MEFIDLHIGFALLGFDNYKELQRVAQLCRDKYKPIAFKGEPERIKEIQARHWIYPDHFGGYIDYHYPLHAFYKMAGSDDKPNRKGCDTAILSIASAVHVLQLKTGIEVIVTLYDIFPQNI